MAVPLPAILLLTLALAGCFGVPVGRQSVRDVEGYTAPQTLKNFEAQEATRQQVIESLGEPTLATVDGVGYLRCGEPQGHGVWVLVFIPFGVEEFPASKCQATAIWFSPDGRVNQTAQWTDSRLPPGDSKDWTGMDDDQYVKKVEDCLNRQPPLRGRCEHLDNSW